MSKRIVITGLGAVTPIGIGVDAFWDSLIAGRSGVAKITLFDPSRYDVQIAAEVKGFDATDYVARRESRRMDRFVQFGVAAALMAVKDANLEIGPHNALRVGVVIGSGIGGLATLESEILTLIDRGPARVSPFVIPMMIPNMASGHVSILLGAKGPNTTVATACATGANAIGDSLEILRRGAADVMIAGGAEAAITQVGMAGFGNMMAMTKKYNDNPEAASRPFDAERDGFVIGEGSGVIVLETLEHATARGAKIYGELAGYGMSSDGHHMTQPDPTGDGVARAMQAAIADAGFEPERITHVNAHATSTPLGDKAEVAAMHSVFGDHFNNVAISGTKSMTGHLLGGAGGIEAIATLLAVNRGMLPPTINYHTPDPECLLDCVPNVARKVEVEAAASNNFGFGGHNAVLVMRRFVE